MVQVWKEQQKKIAIALGSMMGQMLTLEGQTGMGRKLQISPLLRNDSPHPGEDVLRLCNHCVQGTHLILYWNNLRPSWLGEKAIKKFDQ